METVKLILMALLAFIGLLAAFLLGANAQLASDVKTMHGLIEKADKLIHEMQRLQERL